MPRDPKPPLALFSPNSNYQVTLLEGPGATEVVRVFSITDLTRPLKISVDTKIVTSITFSPDSRFLTVTREGGKVENYEFLASSQEIATLPSCATDSTSEAC